MNNERDEYGGHEERNRPGRYEYDEPRGRSARPSSRPVWIVLLAVGCGTVLLCGGAVAGLVFWGVKSFTKDIQPAQAVADQFLDRLREVKISDAYELTSSRFRAKQSADEFAAYLKRFETFTRHTTRTFNSVRLFHDASGKRVFVQTTLNAPNNALTCTLVLVEEGGAWKVDEITVP